MLSKNISLDFIKVAKRGIRGWGLGVRKAESQRNILLLEGLTA
jgi:hypothetical protein